MTETLSLPALVTKAVSPSSLKASSCGPAPTATRPTSWPERKSTIATSASPSSVTQAIRPPGCSRTRLGRRPRASRETTTQRWVSTKTTSSRSGRLTKRRSPAAERAQSSPRPPSGTRASNLLPPKPNSGSTTERVPSSLSVTT